MLDLAPSRIVWFFKSIPRRSFVTHDLVIKCFGAWAQRAILYDMKLTQRQKAYALIVIGFMGIFLPVIPGVALLVLGFALLVDKKGRLDIDFKKLTKKGKKIEEGV